MHQPGIYLRTTAALCPPTVGSGVGTFLIPLTPREKERERENIGKGNCDKSEGVRAFYLHFRSCRMRRRLVLKLKLFNRAQFINIHL